MNMNKSIISIGLFATLIAISPTVSAE